MKMKMPKIALFAAAITAMLFTSGGLATVDAAPKNLCAKWEQLEVRDHDALLEEYRTYKDEFMIGQDKKRICNDLTHIRDECPHAGHWDPRNGFVGHFKKDYCGAQCTFDSRRTKC